MSGGRVIRIRNARVSLVLHRLAEGGVDAPPLLLLHAQGGSSADWGDTEKGWPGPVHALDFSGHGASGWVRGGGYYPEIFAADADAAIAAVAPEGPLALAGAGLGAYVALLLAGARHEVVRAALLLAGAGLDGGGTEPDPDDPRFDVGSVWEEAQVRRAREGEGQDPMVGPVEQMLRPTDYALDFARAAQKLLLVENGGARPPWWEGIRAHAESAPDDPRAALEKLALAAAA